MILLHRIAEKISKAIYLAATYALTPVIRLHLKKRLKRGKEHSLRWREKQGIPSAVRPAGTLIWLHAVGLGEVLALRGMITALQTSQPNLHFLVTSSTVASAETFGKNLPAQTVHQFLPLDIPNYTKQFFDHWHPDLALWTEQDIWPGLVYQANRRGIPQALINARMNTDAALRRQKVRALYRSVYRCFSIISAQDSGTAEMLIHFDVEQTIRLDGSLKPHASALIVNQRDLKKMQTALAGVDVWLAASCHAADENIAISAHRLLCKIETHQMLILAPRNPDRAKEILEKLTGFKVNIRSRGEIPDQQTQVYLADTFAEMGLWYKLSRYALIGGTFSEIEGHNPWEPLQLGCAVMHGPRVENFANDFNQLNKALACFPVYNANDIVNIMNSDTAFRSIENYQKLALANQSKLDELARDLVGLIQK